MRKCIVLNNLELTQRKSDIINNFFSKYLTALEKNLLELPLALSSTHLHHLTYSNTRESTSLPSDIVQEARKDTWKNRKHIEKSGYNGQFKINNGSIRLNKRWFKFVETERGNPCFKITYSSRKAFTIPIRIDNQWKRFQEFLEDSWSFDNISLFKDGKVSVVLEKEFPERKINQRYVVGIDIGSSTLCAVTVFDIKTSKVVRQLYFGRDVAQRQRKYIKIRAKLQELVDKGSERAKKSLRKLKHKQRSFVKTRSGQVAKEIVNLAKSYDAYISIEKLKNIRARKGKFNKKARKKINRIPYGKFKEFLKSNCEMFQVPLYQVDPYHTSKWCPHCGAINNGHHSKNHAIYKCSKCELVVNSDRKASLAIAIKSVLERNITHSITNLSSIQNSKTGAKVNLLFRPDAVGSKIAVQHFESPMESSLR